MFSTKLYKSQFVDSFFVSMFQEFLPHLEDPGGSKGIYIFSAAFLYLKACVF